MCILKTLFFKTLYHWVAAFDFNISSFQVSFLPRFLLGVSYILPVYLSCVLRFLMNLRLLIRSFAVCIF
jgi:hypothetical protein